MHGIVASNFSERKHYIYISVYVQNTLTISTLGSHPSDSDRPIRVCENLPKYLSEFDPISPSPKDI